MPIMSADVHDVGALTRQQRLMITERGPPSTAHRSRGGRIDVADRHQPITAVVGTGGYFTPPAVRPPTR